MGNEVTWCERAFDSARMDSLVAKGLSPLVARLLAARGVGADDLESFFDTALTRLVDPFLLPGVGQAVELILSAIQAKKKIVIFGDYDADGVCASSILVSTIRRLQDDSSSQVDAFIPLRFGEGYGMTAASLSRLRTEHPDVALVVTVDNGISSPNEVASLRQEGISVIVTDHHLPGERLPEADALINPRVASCRGCENLCGAGVAFYLAMALARAATASGLYSGPKFGGPLLVLAGLATVADLMPLQGQNRLLVTQALHNFARCAPLGLSELYARAARLVGPLVARDFGFALAPRINAAGRMKTARTAYELIMCTDRERARALAIEVDSFNALRKTEETHMFDEADVQILRLGDQSAYVVRQETCPGQNDAQPWHLGVAGIVASRLLEKYHVPIAVMVGDTGSVRAPDGYNVHDALTAATEHLVRFGGHAAAGGFTIKPDAFEAFQSAFIQACASQHEAAPQADALPFDAWVQPSDLTLELTEALQRLEPFGEGNPEPVFGLSNISFSDIRPIGAGRHAVFNFVNRLIPRAVWWGHGPDVESLRAKGTSRFDILFTVTTSDYGGEPLHVELRLVALRPAVL